MILFEDDFFIAVYKPNNILVHHSKMANNQTTEKSLVQLLALKYTKKYYPIHRLDRKISGIVLFAKEKKFVAKFQDLFVTNSIQKTYFGIVRGFAPTLRTIDSDVKGRDSDIYKTALTELTLLATKEIAVPVTPYNSSRYSLVLLFPKIGRLHQLRIHLNKINHPLIDDPKYGDRFHNRMFIERFDCNYMFLHAGKIEFRHPFSEVNICILADFTKDWYKIAGVFGWELSRYNFSSFL